MQKKPRDELRIGQGTTWQYGECQNGLKLHAMHRWANRMRAIGRVSSCQSLTSEARRQTCATKETFAATTRKGTEASAVNTFRINTEGCEAESSPDRTVHARLRSALAGQKVSA